MLGQDTASYSCLERFCCASICSHCARTELLCPAGQAALRCCGLWIFSGLQKEGQSLTRKESDGSAFRQNSQLWVALPLLWLISQPDLPCAPLGLWHFLTLTAASTASSGAWDASHTAITTACPSQMLNLFWELSCSFLRKRKIFPKTFLALLMSKQMLSGNPPLSSSLRGWVCTSPNIFPSATNHLFSLHGRFYFPLILDAVTRVFCIFFPKNCLAIFYSVRISYFSNVYTVQFLYEDFFLPRGKNAEGNVWEASLPTNHTAVNFSVSALRLAKWTLM